MIKVRLAIGDINNTPLETDIWFKLIYISADNRFAAPIKAFENTTYPEQEGENVHNKTVDDAFDYKVSWFIKASDIFDANQVISNFNSYITDVDENGVKTFKRVVLYNDYKKVKIVGIPSPISEAKEFWRDANGKLHEGNCEHAWR